MSAPGVVGAEVAAVLAKRHPRVAPAASEGWDRDTWNDLVDLGYPTVSVPIEHGGSGGSVVDAIEVLIEVGRFAVSAPVAEAGLLGGWLLAAAGLDVGHEPLCVHAGAPGEFTLTREGADWVVSGQLDSCAWAPVAERLVLLVPDAGPSAMVASIPIAALRLRAARGIAGEPQAEVRLDGVRVGHAAVAPVPEQVDTFRARGALTRAAMMVGALDRIREMTVDYAGVRTQFGRPIARFQAVAQSLAQLGEQAESSMLAVRVAARMFAEAPIRAAGLAKVTAGLAAESVVARAHQIHAAIGMTMEYPLQLFTRRLYAWSAEYGGEAYWSERIGRETLQAGWADLWPRLTAGAMRS